MQLFLPLADLMAIT